MRPGDGFFGAGSPATEAFAGQVRLVREALAGAARAPDEFPIAKRVYIAVEENAGRARTRISEALHRLYGDGVPGIEDVPVADTVADCVRGCGK